MPCIVLDVTLIEEADGSCILATHIEVMASFSSLVATHVDSVPMAFMMSLRVGSGSSSVMNPSSDDAGSGCVWAFFLFLILTPFWGVLHCLSSCGAIVE